MLISHKISFKLNALFIKDTLTRSGAAAARQAHNLEVGGSNPPSATRQNRMEFCFCPSPQGKAGFHKKEYPAAQRKKA